MKADAPEAQTVATSLLAGRLRQVLVNYHEDVRVEVENLLDVIVLLRHQVLRQEVGLLLHVQKVVEAQIHCVV